MLKETQPDGNSIEYGYDGVGNGTSLTTTVGVVSETTVYAYDTLNRLASVTDPNAQTTSYGYDAVGNRDSLSYPNGNVTTYSYDSLNRLTTLETKDSSDTVLVRYDYTLAATGHRTQVTDHTGAATSYSYDDLYRLIQENINGHLVLGNVVNDYQYDPVGNRTFSVEDGVSTAYSYDANDRLLTAGGEGYTYDANGNTLSVAIDADLTTYSYDANNRLIGMIKTENGIETDNVGYQYDVDGLRVTKDDDGVETRFFVDRNRDYGQVLKELDSTNTPTVDYLYGDDLIKQTRAANDSYYLYDGLGSTRALTDETGTITDTYDYTAYGVTLNQTGTIENSYLFAGEQFDQSRGLYNLRARLMDPETGRFTQMDEWMGIDKEPLSLNKYVYTEGDPVNNVDPSGYFLVSISAGNSIRGILATTAIQAPRLGFSFLTNAAGHVVGIAATTCVASYAATHFGITMPVAEFSNACQGGHRGRWQAQGGGLEESEAWSQSTPLTLSEGLAFLTNLENKLRPKDRRARAVGFEMARLFATRAAAAGGVSVAGPDIKRSFPPGQNIRVDLEIRAGTAFIPN